MIMAVAVRGCGCGFVYVYCVLNGVDGPSLWCPPNTVMPRWSIPPASIAK
jgi:hypothetical protein